MKNLFSKITLISLLLPLASCGYASEDTVFEIKFSEELTFPSGTRVLDSLFTSLEVRHPGSNETITYSVFDENNDPNIKFTLYKDGSNEDVIDEVLESGQKYNLFVKYGDVFDVTSFTVDEKVSLLKKEDFSITYHDVDPYYSVPSGNVKMLVIPVNLQGSWLDPWDSSYLDIVNDLYFGDGSLTLKSYYNTASNGVMNFSGMVSEVFDYTTHTSNEIQNNQSYLVDMLNKSLAAIENNHPEIDWKEYDLDQNGVIDNIHIVTNFDPSAYESETGKSAWSTNLWPHMSMLNNQPSKERPTIHTYSCGVLNHLTDGISKSAITPIHEQGHIFGLPDYYDYAGLVDYLGSIDMQSANVLDWNSYSKLSVGWTDALVVKDACTVTIDAASLGGKCLIIPANPETFNNSAFDEYFLIELFSKHGNNAKFGYVWNSIFGKKGGFGAKLYHVDGRLFNENGNEVSNPRKGFQAICNNSYDYTRQMYPGFPGLKKLADMKLLTIIQKGGVDTFGDENQSYGTHLKEADLFSAGDIFTFEKYSKFLSKRHYSIETMDNGEKFPYTIEFLRMDDKTATIKITK